MLGFCEICGIEEGMDLQLNIEHQDKAAVLLRILLESFEALPESPSLEQLDKWRCLGIQKLKSHKAGKYYQSNKASG